MSDDSTISDVKCDHLVMVVSGKFFFLKIPFFFSFAISNQPVGYYFGIYK